MLLFNNYYVGTFVLRYYKVITMSDNEIKPNAVYTTAETKNLLKISTSSIKRFLKQGLIRANKVGGQYRILGKEILRLVSPAVEERAVKSYLRLKNKVVNEINQW